MLRTHRCIVLAAGLALALLAGAAPQAGALRFARVQGTITAVNASPSTVTISNGPASVTLNVTSATRIFRDDSLGTSADLVVGRLAQATYETRTLNALSIHVQTWNAVATGTIMAADPVAGTLTLDTNGAGTANLTLNIDDQTEIELGDATLARDQLGLLVGLRARVKYDSTSLHASEVEVDTSQALFQTGQVTAIDAVGGTVTIQPASGPSLTLLVPPGGGFRLLGHRAPLTALLVGDTVRARYLVNGAGQDLLVSGEIRLGRPQAVEGPLAAVGTNTITVTGRSGPVTLLVDAQTDLRLNGLPTDLPTMAAALNADNAAGRTIRTGALYFTRGTTNWAAQVLARDRGRR
jgi:hypothetical protein